MSIFNFFKRVEPNFSGLIIPTQKELDDIPTHDEIVGYTSPVSWKLLDIDTVKSYPVFNQDGSGSCVAQSWALIASILYEKRTGKYIKFSPAWIYQQRSNKPGMGMIGTNVAEISATSGHIPYDLMPSDLLNESQINSVKTYPWFTEIAKVFRTDDRLIQLPVGNIDTLVSTMQVTDKPVNVWFAFDYNEWRDVPVIIGNRPSLRHSVVAIDYGLYNGKKAIVIQDSWGKTSTKFNGKRIITEDFFKARNLFSAYSRRFKFDITADKVSFNGSIMSLQECLRSIGLFPQGVQFVESLGPITRQGLREFQKRNNIPQSGIIDFLTKAKLLEIFN